MAQYEQNGEVEIRVFVNKNNHTCVVLSDLIRYLKEQQKQTPNVDILHYIIRDLIKVNNQK